MTRKEVDDAIQLLKHKQALGPYYVPGPGRGGAGGGPAVLVESVTPDQVLIIALYDLLLELEKQVSK